MFVKRHIPNAITCGNLLCGCLAIVKIYQGDMVWAAALVGIAAVLDFLDGMAARMLKISSPIGKDLDSLADMVTFGVVPGLIVFDLLKLTLAGDLTHDPSNLPEVKSTITTYWPYLAFIIPIFSAIRLAKFNNDTRQSDSFLGLPVPANAILICSLPVLMKYDANAVLWLLDPWIISISTLLLSFLLVSELPLIALKFKSFGWQENKLRFIFLSLSAGMLVALQLLAIPAIIILYILISIVNNIFSKKQV